MDAIIRSAHFNDENQFAELAATSAAIAVIRPKIDSRRQTLNIEYDKKDLSSEATITECAPFVSSPIRVQTKNTVKENDLSASRTSNSGSGSGSSSGSSSGNSSRSRCGSGNASGNGDSSDSHDSTNIHNSTSRSRCGSGNASGNGDSSDSHDSTNIHNSTSRRNRRRREHRSRDGTIRFWCPIDRRWKVKESKKSDTTKDDVAPVLLLKGPRFSDLTEFRVSGKWIRVEKAKVKRDVKRREYGDTGTTIWDGSVVLAKYVEYYEEKKESSFTLKGERHVLELGSGTGLTGLSVAAIGRDTSVTLTDLPYCLDTLRANVEAQTWLSSDEKKGRIHVKALDWTRPPEGTVLSKYSLVLAADCVWVPDLVGPFVDVLKRIAEARRSRSLSFRAILSHQTRSLRTDRLLFDSLKRSGFVVREGSQAAVPAEYRVDAIRVFEIASAW
eukprot:g2844.t1